VSISLLLYFMLYCVIRWFCCNYWSVRIRTIQWHVGTK